MTDTLEKKQRAARTPRSSEQVFKGALALELADRVELRKQLEDSIAKEVNLLEQQFKEATALANGTK